MRPLRLLTSAALLCSVTGCRSAFIDTTIHNGTAGPIRLVELDYPSASFGTSELAAGKDFHYRFKVLGSGDLKLIYTDPARQEHDTTGPRLSEGDEGSLAITVTSSGVQWSPQLKHR